MEAVVCARVEGTSPLLRIYVAYPQAYGLASSLLIVVLRMETCSVVRMFGLTSR